MTQCEIIRHANEVEMQISMKFKEFIHSFDEDPFEVAIYIANYLHEQGINANGTKKHSAMIPLFDEDDV